MSDLFKFPLKILSDRGTIRIEQANGEVVIPEFLWNGTQEHFNRQMERARKVLRGLWMEDMFKNLSDEQVIECYKFYTNEMYDKRADNFCDDGKKEKAKKA